MYTTVLQTYTHSIEHKHTHIYVSKNYCTHPCARHFCTHTYSHKSLNTYTPRIHTKLLYTCMYANFFTHVCTKIINAHTHHTCTQNYCTHTYTNIFSRTHTQKIKYIHTTHTKKIITHMNEHKIFAHTHTHKSLTQIHTTYAYKIIARKHAHNIFADINTQSINTNTLSIPKNYYTHVCTLKNFTNTCTQIINTHTHQRRV